MPSFLIHLGVDDCYRVPVLRESGFFVEECHSVRQLHSTLMRFPQPDAVAIAESDEIEAKEAVFLVRKSDRTAPLVLFQGRNRCFETSGFNLVVPPLTDPLVWLSDLVSLIERHRTLRGQSNSIRAQSTHLQSGLAKVARKARPGGSAVRVSQPSAD